MTGSMNASDDPLPTPFRFFLPTEIVFGANVLYELAARSRSLGRKALVVTGRHSARATGILDKVLNQLPEAVVFDRVEENPASETCDAGAVMCRSEHCDLVIGLGGGSPIDAAKAIAGLALNDGPCASFFGTDTFKRGSLPMVAIPTTAGTGSEVTPGAVIVDTADRVKRTISGKDVFPKLAILDPGLTLSLPRHITVNTGLDALSQAMEGIVSRRAGPFTDTLGFEACRLIRAHLPLAAAHGDNISARTAMLYASLLSGCVIAQTGTTLVHGMGYYLTLECGIPHGLANALLLAPLFRHNARLAPEKAAAIATALGVPCNPMLDEAAERLPEAIYAILAELGVSPAARDHGVKQDQLCRFAEHIITDPYRFKNQIGDLSLDHVLTLFQEAYDGCAP